MAGLEGSVKTPFGTMEKKTVLIAVGGVAILGGIVWFRMRNQTPATDTTNADINPATGYPYGSPEDLAALAAQNSYVTPGGDSSGGGSPSPSYPPGTGFVSNGQWVQAVIEYMTANGLVEDPSQLSTALGKYITGAPATDTDVNLIQQAIAVEGFPPVSGPNGYPPAINRAPVPTPTPTPIPTPTPTPGGPSTDPIPPPVMHIPPTPTPKPSPKPLPKRRYVKVVRFTSHNPPWNSTLWGIAGRAHRTVGQLQSWNGIKNPNLIYQGQKIWVDPSTGYSGQIEFKG